MASILNPPIITNHEVAARLERTRKDLVNLQTEHAKYLADLNRRVRTIEELTLKQLLLLFWRRVVAQVIGR